MPDFFEDCMRQIQFDAAEQARLISLHDVLAPHFAAIADSFYAAMENSPAAMRVFKDEAQIQRLKVTLVEWMGSGLLGPHDERFYERRSRIGRRHVTIGLAQHYMFTAMNTVRTRYIELIAERCPANDVPSLSRAVNRLLDLELMLMLRHYQIDSEERLVQRERVVQAERLTAMQTLSAGLAHEVRNPLNAAALQLELLNRRIFRSGDDPKLAEPTKLVHHELQRLSKMLNEFVSFARPPQLDISQHDLIAVVKHVLRAEQPLADKREVRLELQTSLTSAFAEVDGGKVHQIVQNLVRNAIEAAPGNSAVQIDVDQSDERVAIAIEDHGPGIPEEIKRRMFEPFFSTKEAGTGLGMAIVHSLVAQHQGTLTVTTEPGQTRFVVELARRAK